MNLRALHCAICESRFFTRIACVAHYITSPYSSSTESENTELGLEPWENKPVLSAARSMKNMIFYRHQYKNDLYTALNFLRRQNKTDKIFHYIGTTYLSRISFERIWHDDYCTHGWELGNSGCRYSSCKYIPGSEKKRCLQDLSSTEDVEWKSVPAQKL